MKHKIKFYIAGALIGFINGLFGGGGGMICVPALHNVLKLETKKAHATAIAVMLPISVVSGIFYLSFGSLDIPMLLLSTLGVFAGGFTGSVLLKKMNPRTIRILFSILLAVAGVRMMIGG